MFKKTFCVPLEDSSVYPTFIKAMEEISRYCEDNGESCTFTGEDEVEIDGVKYEIIRGLAVGGRGNYGIKCKEK